MKSFLFCSVLVFGLAFGVGSPLRAQELPKAEAILDKETEAVGGKAIADKVKTAAVKAKVAVQDLKLDLLVQVGPTKYYKALTLDGVGTEEIVVSGEAVWKKNSITGAEFLEGDERAMILRDVAEFTTLIQPGEWRQRFKEAKCVAEETVDGKPAYKVELTTKDGATKINHYDKESGLLIQSETTIETPEGKVKQVEHYSDFRKVDGVVHAFKARIVGGPVDLVVTIDQIEYNVDLPEERFVLPAELKKQK